MKLNSCWSLNNYIVIPNLHMKTSTVGIQNIYIIVIRVGPCLIATGNMYIVYIVILQGAPRITIMQVTITNIHVCLYKMA